jgi:ADP-heptose:LPS heptosyltransferase
MTDERKRTIGVLRLDRIGDLILTGPFLVELRAAYPDAHIVLAVTTTVAPLARRLPLVDEILTTPDRKTRWFGRVRRMVVRYRLTRALRRQRPDLIIVPRWDFDHYGALEIVRRVGAPVSVGFAEAAKRLPSKVFTRVVDAPAGEPEALKPLRLLPVGHHRDWPELEHPRWYSEEDVRAADALLASANGPLIIFGIGADEARKTWPAERFAQSAITLCADFGAVAVVVGSRDEGPAATRFAAMAPNCVNLVGATSLPVAAAVIARSALYVGNDSGPMHMAAAAGVPVVEISCHPRSGGPEHRYSPARFGPRPGPAALLQPAVPAAGCGPSCSAREPHCILATSVEEVVSAGRQLLSAVPSSRARDHDA